jgi:cell fate regulator YaaT (PSP1 superfamily)
MSVSDREGRHVLANVPAYLVSHGSSGGFGSFTPAAPLTCRRGDRVVVRSARGLEIGVVLCEATPGHSQLLPGAAAGELLRHASAEDEQAQERLRIRSQELFAESRRLAVGLGLPLEVLDVELLLDGRQAIMQYLAWQECDVGPLVDALAGAHRLVVHLEDLGLPAAAAEEEHGGCGQPGCGRAEGGSCSTCGTGGCSSCGSGHVDLRAYFAHLRSKVEEAHRRTSLL